MLRFVVVLSILILSCKSKEKVLPISNNEEDQGMIFIMEDSYFPTEEPLNLKIDDQKTLNNFFSKLNRTRKPGISAPIVDFEEHSIIISCVGEQKNVDRIKLLRKSETENSIEIEIVFVEKKSSQDFFFYPFAIYKLVKTNKKIIFK